MLKEIQFDTFETVIHDTEQLSRKVYFFHDVRVICQTNHAAILTALDEMLGIFPEPEQVRGEILYYVLCYENAAHFPVKLPHSRRRTETVRLTTGTKLKYYTSADYTTEYQSYVELPPMNGSVLSAIGQSQHLLLTQLEMPQHYQASFLRRYVFLLALGRALGSFGFEPCHAAAITAPWDSRQGALIIGASGSGKTTLSLGCLSSGYGALGDDLVMLREHGADSTISAYAISHEVSVRSDSLAVYPALAFLHTYPVDSRDKRYCSIEEVRADAARFQTPIRLLLFPSLTTETQSRVTSLSKARTLQSLVDLCMSKVHAYAQPQERLFALLSRLAEQAPGYRLAIARNTNDGPRIIRALTDVLDKSALYNPHSTAGRAYD